MYHCFCEIHVCLQRLPFFLFHWFSILKSEVHAWRYWKKDVGVVGRPQNLENGQHLMGMKENMLSKFPGKIEHYWEMDMRKTTIKNETIAV